MKRTLLPILAVVAGLLVFSSSALLAQGMRMTPKDRADTLKARLSLSAKQTDEVTKIYEAQQKEFQKLREDNQGDRDAMREGMTKIMQQTDEKIEKLLDKDQLKKYEAYKKERMERMQQRRPGN
jgi:acyl-CoA reductase-like NAD-dependent aldehyde dehydrogenase